MADDKRHFRNKAVATTTTSSKAPAASTGTSQQQLDSETCTNVARQLMKKCLEHYEGQHREKSTKKAASASSFGTLYCGALGPRVYLRLHMAQHLKSVQQVANQKPAAKKTRSSTRHPNDNEIQSLLQDARKLAEEAVEIESERMEHHSIRVSLLNGQYVGAKSMLAALYYHTGLEGRAREEGGELLEFLEEHTTSLPSKECEVLYGRAGALQAVLFLRQEFEESDFGSEEALAMAQSIVNEGLKTSAEAKIDAAEKRLPLLWEWHGKKYLGAAHGVVGILHTLLGLTTSELEQISVNGKKGGLLPLIQETIRALDGHCWSESGNLHSSMESSSPDKLVHWCHGAPGHVLLLVKAYEVFQDVSYLEKAREIGAKVIWPRGLLRKGVGLCHGISGNAYCLLALGRPHKCNKDENENCDDKKNDSSNGNGQNDPMVWMKQACSFAAFSLEKWSSLQSVPDHPYSIFEGAGALSLLMMDLGTINHKNNKSDEDPTVRDARFPLYDF